MAFGTLVQSDGSFYAEGQKQNIMGLGLLLATFGGYILYEKVYLAILIGHSHERAGIVVEAIEPFSFWLGILTYGTCSSLVIIAGIVLMVWR